MVVDGCQSPECFQGMFADVFHELMDMMNFTYTMMMPKDGQWGAQRDNGSWTGVIGLPSLRKCCSALLVSKNLLSQQGNLLKEKLMFQLPISASLHRGLT